MRELAFDLLHPLADESGFFASYQKVRVVGSQTITEDLYRKLVQAFPHDLVIAVAVFGKLEQELAIMTTMSQMIEFSGEKVAVGSGHGGSIDEGQKSYSAKRASKNGCKH